VNLIK